MEDLLYQHHGAYGISSAKLAQLLQIPHEELKGEINFVFHLRMQYAGFASCADYFVSEKENGFWISHKGCIELQKECFPEKTEVWNKLKEVFRTAEEKFLLKFCHTVLEGDKKYNEKRTYQLPEKAFMMKGSQYIHSDGIIIRLHEQHDLEMIPEKNVTILRTYLKNAENSAIQKLFFR